MEIIIQANQLDYQDNLRATDDCGWDGGCSYDCSDCGCDSYDD
jgi:hypothetical protein